MLLEIPDRVYGDIEGKVCGLRVVDWDVEHKFSAASEFAQQFFAVEEPRVWKFLGWSGHGAGLRVAIQ